MTPPIGLSIDFLGMTSGDGDTNIFGRKDILDTKLSSEVKYQHEIRYMYYDYHIVRVTNALHNSPLNASLCYRQATTTRRGLALRKATHLDRDISEYTLVRRN